MWSPLKSPVFAACLVLLGAPSAFAADLAAQSRLGAVFAEPPARATFERHAPTDHHELRVVETVYALQPRLPGYYGRPSDFEYRNYYGTSPVTIFSRLPYACGLIGLC